MIRDAAIVNGGPVEALRNLGEAEQTLRNGERHLRQILDTAPVAFVSLDAEGLILDWNEEAELVFGCPRQDALGRQLAETIVPQPVRRAFERDLADLLAAQDPGEPSQRAEMTAVRSDGHEVPVDLTICRVNAGAGYLFNIFARDISAERRARDELRYAEERLTHQALHDPLTGLPNRTLLVDRVAHAMALAERRDSLSALLHVDIDNFRLVNDSLGHEAGDELLVRVVRRLQDVLRASDTIARVGEGTLARVGADEFVVLCEGLTNERDAIKVADRISSALREPIEISEQRFFVKLSIGISLTAHSATPKSLIRDAEAAVHRAKERGGARYELFDAETRARVLERVRKEDELRDAIDQEQLRLFYQPIVSVIDGHLVGVEALLRWQHPDQGLLAPGEFIGLAEESGLIIPIGQWVLRQAVSQLAEWCTTRGASNPLHVSVNVSARQLVDEHVVNLVRELLDQYPIKPSQLILEITETTLLDDTDERVALLDQLRALGVRLALDDFGTGYSSLGYLRRLPFNVLKLDRSFISNLEHTMADSQIAAAMIELARAMAMTVIAEGVETEEQLVCLQRLGCHFAQGYLFAKPMPQDQIAQYGLRSN